MDLKPLIPLIPDFPRPGVGFLDITGVLHHPQAFAWCVGRLADLARVRGASSVVAVESRGFVFGAPVAQQLGVPLVLARKPGKLPGAVHRVDYQTEYSSDALHLQRHAPLGERPWLVDDVLATGGTLLALADLLQSHFGVPAIGAGVVVCLDFLPGAGRLADRPLPLDALERYSPA